MTETARRQLDEELRQVSRDRSDVTEQLNVATRQKGVLADELLSLRREFERQGDTVVRLSKEKEDLSKEKAELNVHMTAVEQDNRQLSEVRESFFSTCILIYFHFIWFL